MASQPPPPPSALAEALPATAAVLDLAGGAVSSSGSWPKSISGPSSFLAAFLAALAFGDLAVPFFLDSPPLQESSCHPQSSESCLDGDFLLELDKEGGVEKNQFRLCASTRLQSPYSLLFSPLPPGRLDGFPSFPVVFFLLLKALEVLAPFPVVLLLVPAGTVSAEKVGKKREDGNV